jgi:hypothetical protein
MFASRYKNITRTQRQNLQSNSRQKENPTAQLKNLKYPLFSGRQDREKKLWHAFFRFLNILLFSLIFLKGTVQKHRQKPFNSQTQKPSFREEDPNRACRALADQPLARRGGSLAHFHNWRYPTPFRAVAKTCFGPPEHIFFYHIWKVLKVNRDELRSRANETR